MQLCLRITHETPEKCIFPPHPSAWQFRISTVRFFMMIVFTKAPRVVLIRLRSKAEKSPMLCPFLSDTVIRCLPWGDTEFCYLLDLGMKNFSGAFLKFVQVHGTEIERTEWATGWWKLNSERVSMLQRNEIISPRKITAGFPAGLGNQEISDHPGCSMNEYMRVTKHHAYLTYITGPWWHSCNRRGRSDQEQVSGSLIGLQDSYFYLSRKWFIDIYTAINDQMKRK